MKIFLDTNVMVDLLVVRDNPLQNQNSQQALSNLLQLGYEAVCSAASFTNIAYLLQKISKPAPVRKIMETLFNRVKILPATPEQAFAALKNPFKDIEDAFLYECARENKCDIILTNNIKDFIQSDIKTLTPEQFVHDTTY